MITTKVLSMILSCILYPIGFVLGFMLRPLYVGFLYGYNHIENCMVDELDNKLKEKEKADEVSCDLG